MDNEQQELDPFKIIIMHMTILNWRGYKVSFIADLYERDIVGR